MAVKASYKQTDVGIIPNDWGVKQLGEIGEAIIGLTYKPTDVRSDGILVLRASNIQDERLRFEDNVFVNMGISEKLMVRTGDVLICVRNGSRELIGKCAQIDKRAQGMTFGAFMTVFRSPYNNFVYHQFQSRIIKKQIREHLGATINQITNKSLNSFVIPLPPTLAEQEAIAEALSDADALIEALEQLIAKKRQVKQGAMQELLHPKDGWTVTTVAELAGGAENIVDGPFGSNLKNSDYVASGIPVLQGLNITYDRFVWKEVRYISHKKAKDLYRSNARVGDLLTVKIGSVGFSAIIDDLDSNEFAIIPANLLRTRIQNPNSDALFVYYLLISNAAKKKLRDLAGNTAQPAIGLTGFRNLSFVIPPSRKEQTAIAEILSAMEAEIAALETKLAKARQVKQGMMQELLTGMVRLV